MTESDMKPAELEREALHRMGYGLYIVSSARGAKANGQIANTVFQVSSEPPRVAIAISKNNFTHEFIYESNLFAVSILAETAPLIFIGLFGFRSGRVIDKLAQTRFKTGATGCPLILENTVSAFEAKVWNKFDVGSHTVFVGDVINAEVISDGRPMSYAYYQEFLRGKTPKDSPTFLPPRPKAT